jgi:hypothetical protein
MGHKLGEYRPKSKTILIRIRRGLDGHELIETLLHEMNHIGTTDHGPKFRRTMARLRDMGAPLGVIDLAWLEQPYRSPRFEIEERIDAIALMDGAAAWTWPQVRRALAADFGTTQRYFDRWPSIRRYWERERRLLAQEAELKAGAQIGMKGRTA